MPGQPVETLGEALTAGCVAALDVPRSAAAELEQRELVGDLLNGQTVGKILQFKKIRLNNVSLREIKTWSSCHYDDARF